MRVLVAGGNAFDSVGSSSASALRKIGHTVDIFDFADAAAPWPLNRSRATIEAWSILLKATVRETRGSMQRRLLQQVSRFHPDWVVIIPVNLVLPSTIAEIKKNTGARVSGWFQDSMVNFGRADFLAGDWDALCFQDRWLVERLARALDNTRIEYLPQACDPDLHRPVDLSDEERLRFGCDLATYGNLYVYRALMFSDLWDLDLRIYGALQGWETEKIRRHYAGYPVFGINKAKAMTAAKIALNSNHYSEVAGVNKRTFEVAAIGAFQLCDAPGLREMFDEHEVASFSGRTDLRRKVEYYLPRESERQQMAKNASERARRDHTYQKRLERLMELTFA